MPADTDRTRPTANIVKATSFPTSSQGHQGREATRHKWQSALAIACSGGRDSLSLVWRMHHARSMATLPYPCLVVDHGLRASAAAEALATCQQIRRLGMPVVILVATTAPTKTGVMAWARDERYRLLEIGATLVGRSIVALAHHLDDQRETTLLRRMRQSQLWGSAAMPKRRPQGGILLWRPWLTRRRSTIDQCISRAPLTPVEDPSNHDARYTRIRVRKRLDKRPKLRTLLDRHTQKATLYRRRSEGEIESWLNRFIIPDQHDRDWGSIRLDPAFLSSNARSDIESRAIHSLFCHVGGKPYGPRWSKFTAWWHQWRVAKEAISENARVKIEKRPDVWFLTRTCAPVPNISRVGDNVIWDQRFRFTGLATPFLELLEHQGPRRGRSIKIAPMHVFFRAVDFRKRYGIHSIPEGWKMLPLLVRLGSRDDLEPYCGPDDDPILLNNHFFQAENGADDSGVSALIYGCPVAGLDDETILSRLGVSCSYTHRLSPRHPYNRTCSKHY